MSGWSDLDEWAIRFGTDKGTKPARGLSAKSYTLVYEKLLADRRREPTALVEIGIQTGASLRMWRAWAPRWTIVGVDIKAPLQDMTSEYVHVVIGRQQDKQVCHNAILAAGGTVDVLVDDGSHRLEDQIATWVHMRPYMANDGLFIVEDCRASPGSQKWITNLGGEVLCGGQLGVIDMRNTNAMMAAGQGATDA